MTVQFGFFFKPDGDPGCDPESPYTNHSEGLNALVNVSGHELSEMLTDPQFNWSNNAYDTNVGYVDSTQGNVRGCIDGSSENAK